MINIFQLSSYFVRCYSHIYNSRFNLNSFMMEILIIKEPVHWLSEQINSWFLHDRELRHKRVNVLNLKIYLFCFIIEPLPNENLNTKTLSTNHKFTWWKSSCGYIFVLYYYTHVYVEIPYPDHILRIDKIWGEGTIEINAFYLQKIFCAGNETLIKQDIIYLSRIFLIKVKENLH